MEFFFGKSPIIDLYFELAHGASYSKIKARYIGTQCLYLVLFILFIYYRSLYNYIGDIQN